MGEHKASAYREMLGKAPVCAAGETEAAREYLGRIEGVRGVGGWTAGERDRLGRLWQRWAVRASGKDPRFQVVGTRPGRLDGDIEEGIGLALRRGRQAHRHYVCGGRG